jgi:hypothetical protein
VADKPIIKIQIDAEDFDKFADKFNAYREKLKTQPEEWKATNEEIKEMRSNFEDAGKALDKVQQGAKGSPVTERKEKERSKRVKEDEKSWKSIGKSISGSYRDLSGLAKMSVGIASGGKRALASFGALGAIYGAILASANGLAERNTQNRQLDVAPGVAKAYGKAYAKFGGSEQQLATFEQAKVTPSMWQPLLAVGVTQQEIQTDDAEQLAATYLRKGGQKWESLPEYARGNWMAGTRQGELGMTVGSFNQAGSFKDQAPWDLAQSDFEKYRDQNADSQADLDRGTELKQHVGADWDAIVKSFDHNTAILAPALEKWSDAATALTIGLLNGVPKAQKYAENVWDQAKKNLDASGPLGHFGPGDPNAPMIPQMPAIKDWYNGLHDPNNPLMPRFQGVRDWWSSAHPFGTIQYDAHEENKAGGNASGAGNRFANIEAANGLRPGFLMNIERQESSNGKNVGTNTNDSDGPAGPFQIDKGTGKAWGVGDRMDEAASAQGAGTGFSKLLAKYNGDYGAAVAAYDGFSGIDRDYAKYGKDWRAHLEEFDSSAEHKATRETRKYLSDLEANGADLSAIATPDGFHPDNQIVEETGQPSQGTRKAMSKIAGFQPDNQIIDVSTAGGGTQPPILTRPAGMGGHPATINLNVSAPPGSSVSVTTAGFPQ